MDKQNTYITTSKALLNQSHTPYMVEACTTSSEFCKSKTHLLLKEKALVIVRLFVVVN